MGPGYAPWQIELKPVDSVSKIAGAALAGGELKVGGAFNVGLVSEMMGSNPDRPRR